LKKKLVLGDEYDEKLRQALAECLAMMGADSAAWQWGLGGSQLIETRKVYIGKDLLVIEAETYVGLTITGAARLVDRVASLLAARAERPRPANDS
jgi:hypothetical protein